MNIEQVAKWLNENADKVAIVTNGAVFQCKDIVHCVKDGGICVKDGGIIIKAQDSIVVGDAFE